MAGMKYLCCSGLLQTLFTLQYLIKLQQVRLDLIKFIFESVI